MLAPDASILLCRPDRVGDVIITSAVLPFLRRALPAARLWLLAREAMRPLFAGHPLLAGFVAWRGQTAADLAGELRAAADFGAAVHFHPEPTVLAAAAEAGVPRRVGHGGAGRESWLTDALPDRRAEGRRHEGEANFDLLALLGVAPPAAADLRPSLHPDPAAEGSADALLGAAGVPAGAPIAVLHPSAHSPTLRWPAARFAELAHRLAAERGWTIVLTGDAPDDPSAREVARRFPAAVNLAGRTTLAELAWLLRGARLLVSRDTGASHVAAAMGCPQITLFGRREPIYGATRWRPLADPARCAVVETPVSPRSWWETPRRHWRRGFEAITVEAVLAAARGVAEEDRGLKIEDGRRIP